MGRGRRTRRSLIKTDSTLVREATMKTTAILTATTCALLAGTSLATAAEVTPQRLLNPEPQNWLMNHRTYDGQRFSPLERITKDNVKNLRLAYAVPIGGGTGDEYNESTPLAEDGFLTRSIPGVCSTRSMAAPATWAALSGAWIPSRSARRPI